MDHTPELLGGGNSSGAVVRVGATVRKAWSSNTEVVHSFMRAVRANGIDVPEPFGRDDEGRQVLEYVGGVNALSLMPIKLAELQDVGALVRRIHDASESFDISKLEASAVLFPVPDANLMCHNDLAPWNLIVGKRSLFIDWDGAGPSTRLWDLAYSAQSFGMLIAGEPVNLAARRLLAFVDGYGADATLRAALPDAMAARSEAMFDLLERSKRENREPWATMFVDGHGTHWREAATYVRENREAWRQALTIRP